MDVGIIALLIVIAVVIIIFGFICIHNILENIIDYKLSSINHYMKSALLNTIKWIVLLIVDCGVAILFVILLNKLIK